MHFAVETYMLEALSLLSHPDNITIRVDWVLKTNYLQRKVLYLLLIVALRAAGEKWQQYL